MLFRKKGFMLVTALALCMSTGNPVYAEDTLQAEARGFGGAVSVTLTVEDGTIISCAITGDDETPEVGGAALSVLEQQVVEMNGAEIDGVSGATFTSDAVREAVSAALSGDTEKALLTPGTYTSAEFGMNDDIVVEVSVTEDAITDVQVVSHLETNGIGAPLYDKDGEQVVSAGVSPIEKIPQEIIEYQTINIDSVSGATLTSNAILKAVGNALVEAGGNLSDWQTEIPEEYSVNDQTADVVIVGGGGSGLAAAVSAAENGASVIIVEKNASVGGDTLVCGGIYNAPNPEDQSQYQLIDSARGMIEEAIAETPVDDLHAELIETVKAELAEYDEAGRTDLFDSPAWFALQTWNGGSKVGDLSLIEDFAQNSEPTREWLCGLGMEYHDYVGQAAGGLWQRAYYSIMPIGSGMISTYLRALEQYGDKVTIIRDTAAKTLLTDDEGRVNGVVCEDPAGKEVTFTATKGVVISTGGFAANGELLNEYNTSGKWDDLSGLPTSNRYDCSQGDGIIMATEVGAALRDMDQIQLVYMANMKDGGASRYLTRCVSAEAVFVNKNGERFVREDGRRDDVCSAIFEQPDRMFYVLLAADGPTYIDPDSPDFASVDGFGREYLEKNGFMVVADTFEELAEKLNMDYEVLRKSIDQYNEGMETGNDPFGRASYVSKFENGPFLALPRQNQIHYTMGGLVVDTSARVLNNDGEPIPGLYAAGEVTGGLHGGNRVGGNGVTDTVVYGKIAGESAANMK